MPDQLLVFAAPEADARLAVCVAPKLAREAAGRHALAPGSASALAQALAGTVLLAASDRRPPQARVDVQLQCGGPLKGLLTDADGSGAVRGLVRVNGLDRHGARAAAAGEAGPGEPLRRFDPRPLFASGLDERAGVLSIVRAGPGSDELHRAAFPFAGADLGAALTLFLRNDRARGGEMALEVLFRPGEPLAAVGAGRGRSGRAQCAGQAAAPAGLARVVAAGGVRGGERRCARARGGAGSRAAPGSPAARGRGEAALRLPLLAGEGGARPRHPGPGRAARHGGARQRRGGELRFLRRALRDLGRRAAPARRRRAAAGLIFTPAAV